MSTTILADEGSRTAVKQCEMFVWERPPGSGAIRRQCKHRAKKSFMNPHGMFTCERHEKILWNATLQATETPEYEERWAKLRAAMLDLEQTVEHALVRKWS